ncbi:hypothetical protein GH714_024342 [Hevea brasiliensis]|uniref:glycine hydroxymethyltransferase n=1 Tax=Hevea brasiliensis TaxID=3981 RepID=A0A6A6KTT3_HEVBR|nr:hypothetical protein GH714_024342 [Hevea brasiliensis]
MDLSQAHSGLSLGFHSHSSSNPIPLQLLDQKEENPVEKDENQAEEEENFSILGHPMCIKRQRDGQASSSSSSSPNPPKRVAKEPGLECRRAMVRGWGNQSLPVADPEIHEIMEKEKQRQVKGIELVASENFVCRAVMEALVGHWRPLGLILINGALMCSHIHVHPQILRFTGLLLPGDRIMGLDSPSGGHLSHGYYTPGGKKVSASSIFFESLPYKVNPQTGYVDYDKMEEKAMDFRPKILICGGSSYPREWDYARFRQVADKIGAVLMCDMAHISGIVAAKECTSPFDYCDIVTSTTHKSLRGPRGGIIFCRKGPKSRKQSMLSNGDGSSHYDFEEKINFAVHPSLQGKNYEKVCEMCHITLNKCAIFGDNGAICLSGVRIGAPAMTSRGCLEGDFETIADFLLRAAQITCAIQREHGKFQRDFLKGLPNNRDIVELQNQVETFSSQFAMPGFDF